MAIGTATAIIGSALIGGALSKKSSDKAAGVAKDANNSTVAESRRQFDLVRGDTAGIRALGNNATALLSRLYGYAPSAAAVTSPEESGSESFSPADAVRGFFDRRTGQFRPGSSRVPITVDNETQAPIATPSGPDMSAFFESPDYQYNLAETQRATERSAAANGGLLSGRAALALQRNASGLASREYGSFVDRLMQQAGLGTNGTSASASAGASSAATIAASNASAANARGNAYMAGGAGINNAVQGGLSNYMLTRYLGGSPSGGVLGGVSSQNPYPWAVGGGIGGGMMNG